MHYQRSTSSICIILVLFCLGNVYADIIQMFDGMYSSGIFIDGTDEFIMYGGEIFDDLRCQANSSATIYDGTIGGLDASIIADGFSTVTIYGGAFKAGVLARENSHMYIYGGEFCEYAGGFFADTGAVLDIYGYDFSYHTVGEGTEYWETFLNGKWEDGTAFSVVVEAGYTDYIGGDINLHVIPEPATLSLIALGGFMLRGRKASRCCPYL